MATILRTGYAVYPSIKLKDIKTDSKTGKTKVSFIKELLFGDYIRPYIVKNDYVRRVVTENKKEVEYIKVRCRNADGYIKESDMQAERILEVNFIDVGQGDGCHIVTPEDKHFLIDAGESDNMYRFLKWRFNLKTAKTPPPPFTVVISHPDADHYKGFKHVFENKDATAQKISIDKIYHNGLIEASGSELDSLGTVVENDEVKYITDLCDTDEDYKKRLEGPIKRGDFIKIIEKSHAPKEAVRAGSNPIYDNKKGMIMEIMGPVAQNINGKAALPVFESNKGKTKNGHSIVIKLTIGHLRLLLGGDLNTEAEYYLIHHYSGIDIADIKSQLKKKISAATRKELESQMEEAILKTRKALEVDIAKSCHHGSADFTSEFLRVLNPIVTVISSGDEEPHVHPRPDTLGTIGKHSRGERSLIFSTELARSSKEFVNLQKSRSTKKGERTVTVYGMINVRTDGEKVIIAQKLEQPASGRNWDIHKLEWNDKTGEFEYNQYLKYE